MKIKLNLISPEKRQKFEKNRHLGLVLRLELFFVLVLAVFLIVLASFEYILRLDLSTQLSNQQKGENFQKIQRINELDEKFTSANSQISKLSTIKRDQVYWSNMLSKLNDIIFPNIVVSSFFNDDYSVSVFGNATTRDDLILLKEKLEKEECFSNINLPLSNLVGKDNVDFGISFKINKDCLKKT